MIGRSREIWGPSERALRRPALRSRLAVATAAVSMLALPFAVAAPAAAQQQPAGGSAPMAPNIPVDPTRAASVGVGQVAANPGAYQGREVMLEGRL
ncbi:MAG: hypothetical protein M3O34_11275, partial [Chloroflexota bacterium]|nr:hypothetical protein [Chloroflexota bacterium]